MPCQLLPQPCIFRGPVLARRSIVLHLRSCSSVVMQRRSHTPYVWLDSPIAIAGQMGVQMSRCLSCPVQTKTLLMNSFPA